MTDATDLPTFPHDDDRPARAPRDERTKFNYQWYDPQYRSGGTLADDISRPAIQMTVLCREDEDPWRILAEVGRAAALMGAAIQEADDVKREIK